jgi:hypothetical protein
MAARNTVLPRSQTKDNENGALAQRLALAEKALGEKDIRIAELERALEGAMALSEVKIAIADGILMQRMHEKSEEIAHLKQTRPIVSSPHSLVIEYPPWARYAFKKIDEQYFDCFPYARWPGGPSGWYIAQTPKTEEALLGFRERVPALIEAMRYLHLTPVQRARD